MRPSTVTHHFGLSVSYNYLQFLVFLALCVFNQSGRARCECTANFKFCDGELGVNMAAAQSHVSTGSAAPARPTVKPVTCAPTCSPCCINCIPAFYRFFLFRAFFSCKTTFNVYSIKSCEINLYQPQSIHIVTRVSTKVLKVPNIKAFLHRHINQ